MTAWWNSIARKPFSNEEKKKKTREMKTYTEGEKTRVSFPEDERSESRMGRYNSKLSEYTHLTISDVILLLLDA